MIEGCCNSPFSISKPVKGVVTPEKATMVVGCVKVLFGGGEVTEFAASAAGEVAPIARIAAALSRPRAGQSE